MAALLVTCTKPSMPITPVLCELHWLPVHLRIQIISCYFSPTVLSMIKLHHTYLNYLNYTIHPGLVCDQLLNSSWLSLNHLGPGATELSLSQLHGYGTHFPIIFVLLHHLRPSKNRLKTHLMQSAYGQDHV